MNFIKYSLLFILPLFLLSFMPELSAKSHHRHYHKRSTKTSVSLNVNMDARRPVYYNPAPLYYSPGYTVVTQYEQPTYYEQVTVVRPYPAPVVQQVIVQPQPRPVVGISLFPFFSFWGN